MRFNFFTAMLAFIPALLSDSAIGVSLQVQTDSNIEMLGGLLGGGGGGDKTPQHEIGGTDINLVSANQQQSGTPPKDGAPGGGGGGGDKWLGALPGMEPLKGLFP